MNRHFMFVVTLVVASPCFATVATQANQPSENALENARQELTDTKITGERLQKKYGPRHISVNAFQQAVDYLTQRQSETQSIALEKAKMARLQSLQEALKSEFVQMLKDVKVDRQVNSEVSRAFEILEKASKHIWESRKKQQSGELKSIEAQKLMLEAERQSAAKQLAEMRDKVARAHERAEKERNVAEQRLIEAQMIAKKLHKEASEDSVVNRVENVERELVEIKNLLQKLFEQRMPNDSSAK